VSGGEIRIGSRGSALARAQATLVVEALEQAGHAAHVVIVETEGDRRAPDTAWGEGAFVAAIERALLDGRVDVAVHSAKDVPTGEDPRLRIAAYLPRADPRDALVVRAGTGVGGLADLPPGSRVGTDSPRRTGFVLASRPDLVLHPLHGNVDTRLRRLDAGETDALVLACAGLDRLGRGDRVAERIPPDVVPPAPGQGAIAVQVRRDDARLVELAGSIDDEATRVAVEAERAFLAAAGGGCRAPIGALGEVVNGELVLLGGFARPDGSATAVARRRGSVGERRRIGEALAIELDARLGRRERGVRPRVIVTRAAGQADDLAAALDAAGLEPVLVPAIAVEPEPPGGVLDETARRLSTFAWVVVTSANGARAILDAAKRTGFGTDGPSWAAIAPATRDVLERDGVTVTFHPAEATARAMGDDLPLSPGDHVLVVRGDLAGDRLAAALIARGAEVEHAVAYRTREAPESSRSVLREALRAGPIAAVTFASGSAVRGFAALTDDATAIPAICLGPETAETARAAGFDVLAVAPTRDATALATSAAEALIAQPVEIA
jgi:hydroxymethylbilane synthase